MSNRLSSETSPYLLAHAGDPVDWYPWCSAAFEAAQSQDRPILLSIGYSTCHWCHVMARESFQDAQVARVLNASFVSIKVDREERPDIDSVYMRFCTALSGSGGWPMTIIMTPEQKPFFAGTYLPRDSFGGRMGLLPLLKAVAARWRTGREELLKTGEDLLAYLKRQEPAGSAQPPEEFIRAAAEQLSASFDKDYGGFGSAPKFPAPQNLLFLLRYAYFTGDAASRAQVETTLRQMYRGGIYDHFGGGFSRYSTDREWLAPHFEKTLYDNALLALVYTEAWQSSRMAYCRDAAVGTLDYCLRELRDPSGGFYSGQDADFRGEEGGSYLFTPEEIKAVLGEDDGRHFAQCYDISGEGNFKGRSIPNLLLNQRWNMLPQGYGDLRARVLEYRLERGVPAADKKILTAWNGMLLAALARSGRVFDIPRYIDAGVALAKFMGSRLLRGGRLMACLCAGEVKYPAQLDDYAFYALGLLELYAADNDPAHISAAADCGGRIAAAFAAPGGGYYRSADDAEALILRPMEVFDGAAPSGNSAAAALFDALFRHTGEPVWQERRDGLLRFICARSEKYPAGCPLALTALMSAVYPTRELVCVSPGGVPEALGPVRARYAPELTVLLKTPDTASALAAAAPFTADMRPKEGGSAFYVCSGGVCQAPV